MNSVHPFRFAAYDANSTHGVLGGHASTRKPRGKHVPRSSWHAVHLRSRISFLHATMICVVPTAGDWDGVLVHVLGQTSPNFFPPPPPPPPSPTLRPASPHSVRRPVV